MARVAGRGGLAAAPSTPAAGQAHYRYVAIDAGGRRTQGVVAALSEGAAFEQLKRQGLAATKLRSLNHAPTTRTWGDLTDREAADLLTDLAALLEAGASIRVALSVIGAKGSRASVKAACQQLLADISGGGPLEEAFSRALGGRRGHVPAIIAAGEAAGDVPASLRRAGAMLSSQVRIRDQLVSTLAYPTFVFVTSLFAIGIILFLVVPALAPLVTQEGQTPALSLSLLMSASGVLRSHGRLLLLALGLAALAATVLARLGLLQRLMDRLALDGPFKRIASSLVFGAFSVSLGAMLSAGAPMSDALRLAIRSVRSSSARRRLEPVLHEVREGRALSDALSKVGDFPQSVSRLAVIGETSGALGDMLARAGKLEEDAALRRIEMAGRLIGPAVIVGLGGVIGLLMGGLLAGITHIGDGALQ